MSSLRSLSRLRRFPTQVDVQCASSQLDEGRQLSRQRDHLSPQTSGLEPGPYTIAMLPKLASILASSLCSTSLGYSYEQVS